MSHPTRHQIERSAAGVRQAAAEAGVTLPVAYAQALAADGLRREPDLAVRRIGDGVVILAQPDTDRRLPILLGYADARGQWYRDGRRHHQPDQLAPSIADTTGVEL